MVRAAKSGTVKAFLGQTTRTARSLSALAQVHATMIGQIAAVPPAAADAATIGAWLDYLRQEEAESGRASIPSGAWRSAHRDVEGPPE